MYDNHELEKTFHSTLYAMLSVEGFTLMHLRESMVDTIGFAKIGAKRVNGFAVPSPDWLRAEIQRACRRVLGQRRDVLICYPVDVNQGSVRQGSKEHTRAFLLSA